MKAGLQDLQKFVRKRDEAAFHRVVEEIIRKAATFLRNPASTHEAWALSYVEARRIPAENIEQAINTLEKYRSEPKVFNSIGPILAGILAGKDPQTALAWIHENFNRHHPRVARQLLQKWPSQIHSGPMYKVSIRDDHKHVTYVTCRNTRLNTITRVWPTPFGSPPNRLHTINAACQFPRSL